MRLARTIGCVVATVKNPSLTGKRILLLQEVDEADRPVGEPFAALDAAGVGAGERVFFVTAREAALPFLPEEVPADACVLGVVDRVNVEPEARG
ncbi:MAG TPA: EutN/CcmL family microcompartment protein [Acidobacteriota bacterium]|nr:EutN/CcmL family microcompartment protein [Acidobacteriota bacterium]HQM62115.1 EutN/CcmL family microcompartment protein [Acidobacteriota bacterium]